MDNKGAVETFQRIAKVRGTAVARAEGERCTICQVRLRPAVFTEVRKNDSLCSATAATASSTSSHPRHPRHLRHPRHPP